MTAETVRDWLRRRPYAPFRLKTSDGESYEVRHPEMAFVTRAKIIVGLAERDGIPSRYRTISLLHVTAIEPIDACSAA